MEKLLASLLPQAQPVPQERVICIYEYLRRKNSQCDSNHCWNSDIAGAGDYRTENGGVYLPGNVADVSARRWALGPAGFCGGFRWCRSCFPLSQAADLHSGCASVWPCVGLCHIITWGSVSVPASIFRWQNNMAVPLWMRSVSEKVWGKYIKWLDSPKFDLYFALAIFFPVAPDDFLCLLAGLTPMKFRRFVAIILLGKPLALLAYSWGLATALSWLAQFLGR